MKPRKVQELEDQIAELEKEEVVVNKESGSMVIPEEAAVISSETGTVIFDEEVAEVRKETGTLVLK